ncbi:Retinol dehydrogenase 5 [Mortierella sp. AM989]|nr:Retinol dehydrogenase 5 [Mortierella sp. AM989]
MALTNPSDLVVVITGCDSGFGAEIAEELYNREGFTIYATCLTEKGVEKYNALQSPRVKAIQLDVTNQDDVNRLRTKVEAECPQGVYCVVNNAGIFGGGFFDFASEDSFQKLMDINFMGTVRIIKAMLPSLRAYARLRHEAKSNAMPRARLLSISSVAGRSNPPGHGGYSASKHALESIMDTLRVELSPWEIDVSTIEPFYAKTPLVADMHTIFERAWRTSDIYFQKMYGPSFVEGVRKHSEALHDFSMPSKWVTDAVVDAIMKKNGARKAHNLVGFWWVGIVIRIHDTMPTWMTDFSVKLLLKGLGVVPSDPFLLAKSGKEE